MSLSWLDYLIIGVIGLSMLTGLFRGFVKELMALVVWALAIWLAFSYSQNLDPWLQPYLQDKNIRTISAFLIVFLGVFIAGCIGNAFLSFILHRSGLSGTDRLLGLGFGFVRGALLIALGMLAIQATSLPYQEYSRQSRLYAQFEPVVNWLDHFMPDLIKQVSVLDNNPNVNFIDIAPES